MPSVGEPDNLRDGKKKKKSGRARCCCWPAQWSERPTSAGPFSATLTCVCTRAQLDTTHSHTHTRGPRFCANAVVRLSSLAPFVERRISQNSSRGSKWLRNGTQLSLGAMMVPLSGARTFFFSPGGLPVRIRRPCSVMSCRFASRHRIPFASRIVVA